MGFLENIDPVLNRSFLPLTHITHEALHASADSFYCIRPLPTSTPEPVESNQVKSTSQSAQKVREHVQRNSFEHQSGSMLPPPDYLPPGIRQAQASAKTGNPRFSKNLGPILNSMFLP